MIAHCDGKLARFKMPQAVEFTDVIPRNPTGKVLKRVLREQLRDRVGMTGRLAGRVAVITGGGGGIGEAYCRRFVAEGAKVAVVDIGREQGTRVAQSLADDAIFVATDISDEASVDACRDAVLDAFGTVDVLVNNAALYGELDLSDNSVDYLRHVYDVNVIGQWLMARAFAPTMVQKGRGADHQHRLDRRLLASRGYGAAR